MDTLPDRVQRRGHLLMAHSSKDDEGEKVNVGWVTCTSVCSINTEPHMQILEQRVLSLRLRLCSLGETLLYYHHILYILQQRVSVVKKQEQKA